MGKKLCGSVLLSIFILNGCAGLGDMQLGKGGSVVSGSASQGGAHGAAPQLPRCAAPKATIALSEEQQGYGILVQYGLPSSPLPLVRLMLQQTGCFTVVDRAAGLHAAKQELELANSGMLRSNSNVTTGQLVAADYTITPHIVFSESNAGGGALGLAGLLPFSGANVIAGIAGSVKFKEAQTVLFLTDNRSGVQVAAAEGSASKSDIGAGGLLLGGMAGGVGGGWQNTNEGKVVAAALLDAVSNLMPHFSSQ